MLTAVMSSTAVMSVPGPVSTAVTLIVMMSQPSSLTTAGISLPGPVHHIKFQNS